MEEIRRRSLVQQILEANLSELLVWRKRVLPDLSAQAYVEILIAFFKRDIDQLQNHVRYISLEETPELYFLANLRLQILSDSLQKEWIKAFDQKMDEMSVWSAEIYYVLAMAYEAIGLLSEAKNSYHLASLYLDKLGARKKAAKALQHYKNLASVGNFQEEATNQPMMSKKFLRDLTRLENNFVRHLSAQPLSKFELMQKLFGKGTDFSLTETRFDQLIYEIHRKRPGLIECRGSQFILKH